MHSLTLAQMQRAINESLVEKNARPFLALFASRAEPLDLLCAYALFCRNKAEAAFSLIESFGIVKHFLLDLSSLHLMLRQWHFWGDRRQFANELSENLAMPALIPARGNSKGIPGKNLAQLNGQSLLEIAVAKARQSRFISRVIVDTDSPVIAEASRAVGAEVLYQRPAMLAGDFSDLNDVRVLATSWMELMEGYWYDYLAVLTPPHPLWPTKELDKACEAFIVSPYTSLVSATPTEFQWDAYYAVHDNEVQCVARRKSGRLYARCGAFSLFSRKPNAHYLSNTFKKVYPTVFKTTVYPLSKEHGYDINTPEELAMCRKIYRNRSDVSALTSGQCWTRLEELGLALPPDRTGPIILLHYPEIGVEYALDDVPAFMRLLKTLSSAAFAGRYAVCGDSATAKMVAEHFGLPLIARKKLLRRNGALAGGFRKAVEACFSGPGAMLYVNGYAGGIKPETLARIKSRIIKNNAAFCNTLRCSDAPPQWILEQTGEDVTPLLANYVGFRQKIDNTYVESRVCAGFGAQADHTRLFTDYVLLDLCECIPLISPVNLIVAESLYKNTLTSRCNEESAS